MNQKVMVQVSIEIPEGYEYVDYRMPENGESFFFIGEIIYPDYDDESGEKVSPWLRICGDSTCYEEVIIIKKVS